MAPQCSFNEAFLMEKKLDTNYCQIRLRLPKEIKERIKIVSERNDRSMTAEILFRIKNSFLKDINLEIKVR